MRKSIYNFAKNFRKDYPSLYKKKDWKDSLAKGDIILVDGKSSIYLSHTIKYTSVFAYTEYCIYCIVGNQQTVNSIYNSIEPLQSENK